MPFKSREDLAWAAGLYEGEGSVSTYLGTFTTRRGERRARKTPQCHLQIGMTDIEPLIDFVAAVGIPTRVNGPYLNPGSTKPFWLVHYWGFEKVQAITAMLWPWLSPRRKDQIRTVLLTMGGRHAVP